MKFVTKLFLSLSLLSIFLVVALTASVYAVVKTRLSENYVKQYLALSVTVSDTLQQLEFSTEQSLKSSLQAIYEYLRHRQSIPSHQELVALKNRLEISSIDVINKRGEFVSSTDLINNAINLFRFCDDYRALFRGRTYERTPLMPSAVHGRVTKYSLIPAPNPNFVLNAGFEVNFIGTTLSSALKADKNLIALGLFAPSGRTLGRFFKESPHPALTPSSPSPGISYHDQRLSIVTRVESAVPRCCECARKKLTRAGSDEFYYLLQMEISLADLDATIAALRDRLLYLLVAAILISLVAARWLATKLVAKIEQVNRKTEQMMSSKNLGFRIGLEGKDEIATMARKFDHMFESLETAQKELILRENDRSLALMASQVAHDIRSPLAALSVILSDVSSLPETSRTLIRSAIGRIQDIANDLLSKSPSIFRKVPKAATSNLTSSEGTSLQLIPSLIETVVSEKRIQMRSRVNLDLEMTFDYSTYGLFARVQPGELKRSLSNLIDNASEAIPQRGRIEVRLSGDAQTLFLEVRDNGVGIPKEVLPRLGQRGESHGKDRGLGLGLYHAKRAAAEWGGSLTLVSEPNQGTTAGLTLPKAAPPGWFVSEIRLEANAKVIILDDDTSIHQVWRSRFEALAGAGKAPELIHMTRGQELEEWFSHSQGKVVCLVDYELLSQHKTGLDLIEELGLRENGILVTSRYEEASIQARCEQGGIRLVPKAMAGLIPLRLSDV